MDLCQAPHPHSTKGLSAPPARAAHGFSTVEIKAQWRGEDCYSAFLILSSSECLVFLGRGEDPIYGEGVRKLVILSFQRRPTLSAHFKELNILIQIRY